MPDISEHLADYRDSYIKEKREIGIYRKSKKYARYGGYLSAGAWYGSAVVYFQNWPDKQLAIIGLVTISVIITIMTVLLWLNYRRSEITSLVTSHHDLAVLIDAYAQNGHDGLVSEYEKVKSHLDSSKVLADERRSQFKAYMLEIQDKGDGFTESTFNDSFSIVVGDAQRVAEENIDIPNDEHSMTKADQEPSIITVLYSAVNGDNLNRTVVFWTIFIIVAIAGAIVAFWRGQGWGVLVVTILFAGLRFYDNRTG